MQRWIWPVTNEKLSAKLNQSGCSVRNNQQSLNVGGNFVTAIFVYEQ